MHLKMTIYESIICCYTAFFAAFKKELKIRNKAADGPSSPCKTKKERRKQFVDE